MQHPALSAVMIGCSLATLNGEEKLEICFFPIGSPRRDRSNASYQNQTHQQEPTEHRSTQNHEADSAFFFSSKKCLLQRA
mmetsp:Transcript_53570/g.160322  ORF Transcript_53570/g.160322 Transcript_53570/m.160322 type:complete len:80 (+) Transcript_53570:1926-2165(+)